jgi:C4-dicarboxylate-specific signal transduction histidine kinase
MMAGTIDEMQMLTHDVRNLLSGLNLIVGKLAKTANGDQQILIDSANRRIRNIVDVSSHRLEKQADMIGEMKEWVSVREIVQEVSACIPAIESGSVKIQINLKDPVEIFTCRTSMFRIVYNLILNASNVLQTKDDGMISVSLQQNNGFHDLYISDNGPGMPDYVLEYFFPRLDSQTDHSGRIGLGIPTSVKLAKQLKGSLILSNTNETGTIFTVRLPSNQQHNCQNSMLQLA